MNRQRLSTADYFAITACIFNIGFTGDVIAQNKYSRHQWDTPLCWLTDGSFVKLAFVQSTLFAPVYFTSKAAIFFLYLQLFGVQTYIKPAVTIGILVSALLYIPNIPISAVLEAPAAGSSWKALSMSDKPQKIMIWGIISSSFTVLLDIYIFILPLPIISRLNMPLGRRLQILGIFATALAGIAASVLSLAYRVSLLDTPDITWHSIIVATLAVIEANVAIIVSCMPAFAQLVKVYIGRSSTLRSWQSRLMGRSDRNSRVSSRNECNGNAPKLVTFGAAQPPRWQRYYELTDASALDTQVSTLDHAPVSLAEGQNGIVRSVEISQHIGHE
ncbi:hypothetical protein F4777DRAFT_541126 [Nemania sp. FL0916]|nr:hypothetical protein F4777DRAFT_541126 [Nemania sp. FL0916]